MIPYPTEVKTANHERLLRMLRLNDYECPKCKTITERLAHDDEEIKCKKCLSVMRKLPPVFRINMGPVPLTGHWDDNLQSFVRTNTHRRQLMEQRGVSERGATPKPDGQAWV